MQKECATQAPAMSAFLSKIGLNRHMARSIVNGPAYYGGLGLPDVYTDQGICQLRLLLGHLLAQDQTSKLINVAISYLQLIVGAKTQFFNLPYSLCAKWTEKTWLTSIWQFLTRANLKVSVNTAKPLREQRTGDSFIMTAFVYAKFKPYKLRLINQCRLFHQVYVTSDITTADGWAVWKKALNFLVEKGRLKQPLGHWIANPHQQWSWFIRLSSSTLYHKRPDGSWEKCRPELSSDRGTRQSRKKWYFLDSGQTCAPPMGTTSTATPIITAEDGNLFTVVWTAQNPTPAAATSLADVPTDGTGTTSSINDTLNCFQNIFYETSDYFHRLIGPFDIPSAETLEVLGAEIRNHSLLACSDGSFSKYERRGCHAWVFANSKGFSLLQGAGPIDGHPLLLTPYRSELGGILALLYLLNIIVRSNELREGTLTIFCDNQAALENVFSENPKRGIYPLLAADYDFIGITRKIAKETPITIKHRHVKGHYTGDEHQVEHDLNSLVDTMANLFRKAPPRGFTPKSLAKTHSLQTAVLISDGAIVTSKLKQTVYRNMFAPRLQETIKKHAGWTDTQFHSVDWDAHDIVFRSYSKSRRITVCKSIHRLWHTGAQQVLWGEHRGFMPMLQWRVGNHISCLSMYAATHAAASPGQTTSVRTVTTT